MKNSPIDNLEPITGVKLSDMLGKQLEEEHKRETILEVESEMKWQQHKDECSGCAKCEL